MPITRTFSGYVPKFKYLSKIFLILKKVLGYDLAIDVKVLYLGIVRDDVIDKKDWYLCKILFIACKKAITRNWYKPVPPSLQQLRDIIKEIFTMEKMTFSLRTKGENFLRKWEKWTDFISEELHASS